MEDSIKERMVSMMKKYRILSVLTAAVTFCTCTAFSVSAAGDTAGYIASLDTEGERAVAQYLADNGYDLPRMEEALAIYRTGAVQTEKTALPDYHGGGYYA